MCISGGEIWQRVNVDIMNVCVCVSHNGGYYSNEVPGCLDTYCSPPVSHFPRDRGVCGSWCNVCEVCDYRAQTTGLSSGAFGDVTD